MTPHAFAVLVQKLRAAQKASGTGYKPTADGTQAKALEKQVDAAVALVTKNPFWYLEEKNDG